jgi:4-hydroxybenzoate polyprenyltransferase
LNFLRLLRLPNLLILAFAMYMLRLMVVEPLLIMSGKAPHITSLQFFLIVLSTVLIAAGGYIINDIEDIAADRINKPDKVIINKFISKDTAFNIYAILTFSAVCIGFYLTFRENISYIAYINLIAAGMLYFYSTTYKSMLLIGNIIVSLLTAASLAIVYLTEPEARIVEPLKWLVSGYVLFSFLISIPREIIKDMEDVEGDRAAGCRTLPLVAGITAGKATACIFLVLLITLLITVQVISHQWEALTSFVFVVLFIQIPLVLLIVSVVVSTTKADYHRCSTLAKFIMLTGILSMPVFFYSFG